MDEHEPNNFTSTCKCGARLVWIMTQAHKRHPVEEKSEQMFLFNPLNGRYDLKEVWRTHFENCPFADEFRNKGDKNQQSLKL